MSRERGIYGTTTGMDRYEAHNQQSTFHKMKETYWTTKQAVYKKLGKKEDAHVVSSDAQLDAKLEVFKAIQKSCMDLLRALEKYQDRLCALSQEENAMGRFLKANSKEDKTRAGKMMAGVGKAQSFSSQQRLALRVPLVRLYQEVETFRYRAISDTLMTINRMETARTEYRGALMWMKDVSEELDPDTYKQLEKFRKVQAQVKKTKAKFDRLKLDTMQKIDLLAASRCNMFSHVLANYQSTLLHFWSKTSRTMTAVAESFKGYQYYEFNMLKELAEPSKKLAEETKGKEGEEEEEDRDGPLEGRAAPEDDSLLSSTELNKSLEASLLDLDIPPPPSGNHGNPFGNHGNQGNRPVHAELEDFFSTGPSQSRMSDGEDQDLFVPMAPSTVPAKPDPSPQTSKPARLYGKKEETVTMETSPAIETTETPTRDSGPGASPDNSSSNKTEQLSSVPSSNQSSEATEEESVDLLIDLTAQEKNSGSLSNLLEDKDFDSPQSRLQGQEAGSENFLDFGDFEEKDLEEIKRKQDEEFDITGKIIREEKKKAAKQRGGKDLLTDDLEPDDLDKDDMSLLNEILNAPSTGGDEFSQEWQAVFGAAPAPVPAGQPQPEPEGSFMPSNLLDMTSQMSSMRVNPGMGGPGMGQMGMMAASSGQQPNQPRPNAPQPAKGKKGSKADMSAWFSLFADLDPLANPDAIGKSDKDVMGAL